MFYCIITEVRQRVKVMGSAELRSLGYPSCCTHSTYLIEVVSTTNTHTQHTAYIKLVFDDLDIPPESSFLVSNSTAILIVSRIFSLQCSSSLFQLYLTRLWYIFYCEWYELAWVSHIVFLSPVTVNCDREI